MVDALLNDKDEVECFVQGNRRSDVRFLNVGWLNFEDSRPVLFRVAPVSITTPQRSKNSHLKSFSLSLVLAIPFSLSTISALRQKPSSVQVQGRTSSNHRIYSADLISS